MQDPIALLFQKHYINILYHIHCVVEENGANFEQKLYPFHGLLPRYLEIIFIMQMYGEYGLPFAVCKSVLLPCEFAC